MSHRNGNPPAVRRARSKDPAPAVSSAEQLATERARELRATVTRLKTAQEKLAAAGTRVEDRARYRNLFQFAPDGYLVTEHDEHVIRPGRRSLAAQLTVAQERERRRIATEIHDHIGQSLAFCQLRLGMLRESLGADELAVVDEVRSLLAQAIHQTRSLTFELSPTILYELGLGPAIEWLLDQRGHLGVAFRFESQGPQRRLDHTIEITLFEAVREILSNVIKHSRASAATIRLTYADHDVIVETQDNGVGFSLGGDAARQIDERSLGLLSVRERMESLYGAAEVYSAPGCGTRVRLVVPMEKPRGTAARRGKRAKG